MLPYGSVSVYFTDEVRLPPIIDPQLFLLRIDEWGFSGLAPHTRKCLVSTLVK